MIWLIVVNGGIIVLGGIVIGVVMWFKCLKVKLLFDLVVGKGKVNVVVKKLVQGDDVGEEKKGFLGGLLVKFKKNKVFDVK